MLLAKEGVSGDMTRSYDRFLSRLPFIATCNGRVNPCKNKMDREVQGVEFIPAGKRRPVAESRKDQGTSGFRCAQRSPGLDSDVGPGSGFLDTAKISPGNHRNSSKA